jgi:hypothetical protein
VTGEQARATLLTYQVTADTPLNLAPLRVCSTWRCGDHVTDVTLDYMYNNQGMKPRCCKPKDTNEACLRASPRGT